MHWRVHLHIRPRAEAAWPGASQCPQPSWSCRPPSHPAHRQQTRSEFPATAAATPAARWCRRCQQRRSPRQDTATKPPRVLHADDADAGRGDFETRGDAVDVHGLDGFSDLRGRNGSAQGHAETHARGGGLARVWRGGILWGEFARWTGRAFSLVAVEEFVFGATTCRDVGGVCRAGRTF